MSEMMIKPNLIALVMCDDIYVDPAGKIALVGLFSDILTNHVPCKHGQIAVYVSVNGLRPGSKGKLEIVHGESEHNPIFVAEGRFPDETGPLDVLDMQFIVNNIAFPLAGKYFVRFWGNDNLVGMRPFYIRVVKEGTPEHKEQP